MPETFFEKSMKSKMSEMSLKLETLCEKSKKSEMSEMSEMPETILEKSKKSKCQKCQKCGRHSFKNVRYLGLQVYSCSGIAESKNHQKKFQCLRCCGGESKLDMSG